MKKLLELIKQARYVFVCGNGGSAATAEHFTNDLFSKGVKAICLNSNTSIMTMIGNDFGYDQVFRRQLDLFAEEKDLVIVISASGNSPNIVNVLTKYPPYTTYAITGFKKDNKCMKKADYYWYVDSMDYGVVETQHMLLVHQIKNAL